MGAGHDAGLLEALQGVGFSDVVQFPLAGIEAYWPSMGLLEQFPSVLANCKYSVFSLLKNSLVRPQELGAGLARAGAQERI